MTEGDEYIYTGRVMSMKEVDKKLDNIVGFRYKLGYKWEWFYNNNIKPLFYGKKSDNKSGGNSGASIDKLINFGNDKDLAGEKAMKISFDSIKHRWRE
jgi:hypothetical protein